MRTASMRGRRGALAAGFSDFLVADLARHGFPNHL